MLLPNPPRLVGRLTPEETFLTAAKSAVSILVDCADCSCLLSRTAESFWGTGFEEWTSTCCEVALSAAPVGPRSWRAPPPLVARESLGVSPFVMSFNSSGAAEEEPFTDREFPNSFCGEDDDELRLGGFRGAVSRTLLNPTKPAVDD